VCTSSFPPATTDLTNNSEDNLARSGDNDQLQRKNRVLLLKDFLFTGQKVTPHNRTVRHHKN